MKTIYTQISIMVFWKATRVDMRLFLFVRACVYLIKIDFEVFLQTNFCSHSKIPNTTTALSILLLFGNKSTERYTQSIIFALNTACKLWSYSINFFAIDSIFVPFDYLNTIANQIRICLNCDEKLFELRKKISGIQSIGVTQNLSIV